MKLDKILTIQNEVHIRILLNQMPLLNPKLMRQQIQSFKIKLGIQVADFFSTRTKKQQI